eukprot:scaffold82223_cov15-Tisochrysis_lutea.AAC.2
MVAPSYNPCGTAVPADVQKKGEPLQPWLGRHFSHAYQGSWQQTAITEDLPSKTAVPVGIRSNSKSISMTVQGTKPVNHLTNPKHSNTSGSTSMWLPKRSAQEPHGAFVYAL